MNDEVDDDDIDDRILAMDAKKVGHTSSDS